MEIVETLGLICFGGVFLLAYVVVFAAIAIVSTQAKLRSANRIRKAQARGAFADLETPENRSRLRWLAIVALIGLFGMLVSFGILVLQLIGRISGFYGVTIAIGVVSGIMSSTVGLLMNREINRRL